MEKRCRPIDFRRSGNAAISQNEPNSLGDATKLKSTERSQFVGRVEGYE
jgi:hypothetical protein